MMVCRLLRLKEWQQRRPLQTKETVPLRHADMIPQCLPPTCQELACAANQDVWKPPLTPGIQESTNVPRRDGQQEQALVFEHKSHESVFYFIFGCCSAFSTECLSIPTSKCQLNVPWTKSLKTIYVTIEIKYLLGVITTKKKMDMAVNFFVHVCIYVGITPLIILVAVPHTVHACTCM